jgi:hypothetical protein
MIERKVVDDAKGAFNTYIGYQAGYNDTIGSRNTFLA